MNHTDLPRALRHYESLTTDEKNRLVEIVMKNLGMTTPKPEPIIEPVPIFHPISKTRPNPEVQLVHQSLLANSTPSPAAQMNVQIGDRIPFGQYPQGANGEVQPLEWRVLGVKNGRALLITDKLIDCIKYNESRTNIIWLTCTLRTWMNNEFYNKAFSHSEQAKIANVINLESGNPNFEIKGVNSKYDKIFALSINQAEVYFRNDGDRTATPTWYAIRRGTYIDNKYSKGSYWWLRSPGYSSSHAASVFLSGSINEHGFYVNDNKVAVRPAFWLIL